MGVPDMASCKAPQTLTLRLTDETQSRLRLTSLGLEQLSIIGSVVMAFGQMRHPLDHAQNFFLSNGQEDSVTA